MFSLISTQKNLHMLRKNIQLTKQQVTTHIVNTVMSSNTMIAEGQKTDFDYTEIVNHYYEECGKQK